LAAFGASYWITHSFGQRLTWRTSFVIISAITMSAGRILGEMVPFQPRQRAEMLSASTITDGKATAAGYSNCQLQLE
jgi:predicted MFS family arabinose efflux permease